MSDKKLPPSSQLLDYTIDAGYNFNEDIRVVNNLTEAQIRKIVEKTILWKLRDEYISEQMLEKLAQELGITPFQFESVMRFTGFLLTVYYQQKLDKAAISKETETSNVSQTFLTVFFDFADKYSTRLRELYDRIYSYAHLLNRIYWRIDIKVADTKRNDDPELRIFMDLDLLDTSKEHKRIVFEMKEDNLFMFTKALGDIATEIGKTKEKWIARKSVS